MNYIRSKKGFTLMEMLIVVAIIAVLIAIAIPTFSAQLDGAREGVDDANLRSAKSLAVSKYLMDDAENTAAVTYGVIKDSEGNLNLCVDSDGTAAGFQWSTEDAKVALKGQSTANKSTSLTIEVTGGAVTGTSW
ncbi:MAG: prepilin-type N-terminal cleavage/methylation domain-containing protein [Oscillospiraceae bacterium]|nr:prepilin-type N-terminal cleavage/methylation domain-containing protein [Oscillospiraceae bacterium]